MQQQSLLISLFQVALFFLLFFFFIFIFMGMPNSSSASQALLSWIADMLQKTRGKLKGELDCTRFECGAGLQLTDVFTSDAGF